MSNVILPNAIKPDMSKTRFIASRNNVFSNPDYLTFEHYNCFDGIWLSLIAINKQSNNLAILILHTLRTFFNSADFARFFLRINA